jgi:hypothetical protein
MGNIVFGRTQNALDTPFIPNRNPQFNGLAGPSDIESTDVQSAIEEVKADALANDRFLILGYYGGNSNVGRYLEFFPNQDSLSSPLFFTASARILSVSLQTTSASATCNVGIFDINVSTTIPVYTIVMTAQKRVQYVGTPALATLGVNSLIALRVTSGSINSPTLQITLSAST